MSFAKLSAAAVIATGFLLSIPAPAAFAETANLALDLQTCQSWNSLPSRLLSACTNILQADGLTTLGRSDALSQRGRAFQKLGENDWALADFNEALRVWKDNPVALVDRAEFYVATANFPAAIADYTRAIEINPKPSLLLERGHVYEGTGDPDHAIADFSKAAELEPNLPFGVYDRGRVYLRQENWTAAIADFDAAIKLDSNIKEIFLDRAVAHQRHLDLKEAEADFDSALALDPHWVLALEDRGIFFVSIGEFKKGIADYNSAIGAGPPSARTLTLRGVAYSGNGDTARAVEDFDRALAIDPKYDEASRQKLIAFARNATQRDPDRDLHECDELLTFQPRNVELLLRRASILSQKGRRDEALKSIDLVLQIQPGDKNALEQRARLVDTSH